MVSEYEGVLEIDHKRGVIYFHLDPTRYTSMEGQTTLLRICNLPTIPQDRALDITHMVGCDWRHNENKA